MHVSLDGFVAGPAGEMNWIKAEGEIFEHVGKRISRCDTSMYGRTTYHMMEGYWPAAGAHPNATKQEIEHSNWYANVHKLVLSRTLPEQNLKNTTILSDDLPNRLQEIKKQEGSEILLFGSPGATHSLIQLGLIDGYWLFVNPIILGKGIPLFPVINDSIRLKLLTSRQFNCGVTEMDYLLD